MYWYHAVLDYPNVISNVEQEQFEKHFQYFANISFNSTQWQRTYQSDIRHKMGCDMRFSESKKKCFTKES
jgi:hypothetical protein